MKKRAKKKFEEVLEHHLQCFHRLMTAEAPIKRTLETNDSVACSVYGIWYMFFNAADYSIKANACGHSWRSTAQEGAVYGFGLKNIIEHT
jgi:hypothetical protein